METRFRVDIDVDRWGSRGRESAFGELCFESFDHAGEGRVEELKALCGYGSQHAVPGKCQMK